MQKWGEERIFPHPNIYYRTYLFESMISQRPLSDECPAPRTLMPAPEENETVAAFIKGHGDPDADKSPEKMDTEGPAAQNGYGSDRKDVRILSR